MIQKAYKLRFYPTAEQEILLLENILSRGFSDLVGEEFKFDDLGKSSSVESIEYRRGEELSLFGARHHLASSLKRLEFV